MYINITDSETANKGSSADLVHYLEKENRLDKENAPEHWFNNGKDNIQAYEVRTSLDNNTAKLGKIDAKFFLLNISPSQKEIIHLQGLYGEEGAKQQLKEYAQTVMDEYAHNFKRPRIESGKDLLWFGKLENNRYYNHHDPEVKQGIRKRGERKEGEQMHVQIIVSRKDITNKIKLSPMNNSRGNNVEHSKKVGQFDRSAFKNFGERLFDEKFRFDRELSETFRYANTQKKGGFEDRISLQIEKVRQQEYRKERQLPKEQEIEKTVKKTHLQEMPRTYYLNILFKSTEEDYRVIPRKKKKKRKGELSQGLGQ